MANVQDRGRTGKLSGLSVRTRPKQQELSSAKQGGNLSCLVCI